MDGAGKAFDAATDLDHKALGDALHGTAMGVGSELTPDFIEQRLSEKSRQMFHGLVGYGIPAATAAAMLYAMLSDKKKKNGEGGLNPGLSKLQAARGLDVYIWAYLKDNGVIQ